MNWIHLTSNTIVHRIQENIRGRREETGTDEIVSNFFLPFFFKMGAYPSLCIKVMHMAFILLNHPHKYQLITRFFYISKINRDDEIELQQ
jgi:hypothetical protein